MLVLETEGVDKFKKSWNELVETVQGQMEQAVVSDARRPDHDRLADAGGVASRPTCAAGSPRTRTGSPTLTFDGGRPARRPVQGAGHRQRSSAALLALAEEVGVTERRDAMFRGDHINVTEDRAVLHTALRLPARRRPLEVDGQDVVADVHEVLDRVYAFAEQVRSGAWTGVTGERIRTVVNIGIGGSDLGPVMAYEALRAVPPGRAWSAASSPTSTRPTRPPRSRASTRRRRCSSSPARPSAPSRR